MNIGKAIKTIRLRHKMPQQILAKKIGVTQGYLSLIEKGQREPGFNLVGKISDALTIPQQLILFLACEHDPKYKRFARPLKKITILVDDILKAV